MTEIPLCHKCICGVWKPTSIGGVQEFIGCTLDESIKTFEDAKNLCKLSQFREAREVADDLIGG